MPLRFDAANAHWRVTPLPALSADQKDWLTRGGSLTAHLRALGRVVVRVTREAVDMPWSDEYAALGLAPRERSWVREIVLEVDGVPFVAAHSVTPLAASHGVWQAMRRLRTRPLAELLYSDSGVARSALVSRRVNARHPLYTLAAREIAAEPVCAPHAFVARRSVFERAGAPLLVTECMLPALWSRLTSGPLTQETGVHLGRERGRSITRPRARITRRVERTVPVVMAFKRCFDPVVDAHTRVLILGSLPGEASLAHQQYYAHKQNKFWHLVGDVIGEDLVVMEYEARLQTLRTHRMGLWDVVAQARREGSLDGDIRDHEGNDLVALIERLPALEAIAFNGGTAARIGERILGAHARAVTILRLPSSSPAYASMNFAAKLVQWRALDAFTGDPDAHTSDGAHRRKRAATWPR